MKQLRSIVLLFSLLYVSLDGKHERNLEQTFAMIKSHAVAKGHEDAILNMITEAGFVIIAIKKMLIPSHLIKELYPKYKKHAWFSEFVRNMTQHPSIALILEKKDAVKQWDEFKRVVRTVYAINRRYSAVHGSDTVNDAQREMRIFFPELRKKR